MLLQDWTASTPELRIGSKIIERVNNVTYLRNLISANELLSEEISERIRNAFANLRHVWQRRDIRLSIKERVYCAAVRSGLIYGSESWSLRVEDTRKLLLFDHGCLKNIAGVCWDHWTFAFGLSSWIENIRLKGKQTLKHILILLEITTNQIDWNDLFNDRIPQRHTYHYMDN
ncbi:unnamed protein product [Schistosoma margrebowiei]|uniref:Uncharacterized protein n=1 Tax=Schistosoma margrebowiei TaxID=48269 RepID=A0A183NBA8_9TREM|nr:unnamed protein product [Schistosoma margrebowiei]